MDLKQIYITLCFSVRQVYVYYQYCLCHMCNVMFVLEFYISLSSILRDRAPRDHHRIHSLFKDVFPIPRRNPSKQTGQIQQQITRVTCGLEPLTPCDPGISFLLRDPVDGDMYIKNIYIKY